MERKKVVQIGKYYPPFLGGIENNTRQVAEALSSDFDVEVICMRYGAGRAIQEVVDGIRVHRLASLIRFWRQEIVIGLRKVLIDTKPDIIHFHSPNPLLAIACESYLSSRNTPTLVVTHHADLERPEPVRRLVNWGYERLLEKAKHIIVYTSEFLANSREVSDYAYKASVIPHGIDCPEWVFTKAETRLKKAGIANGIETIGFLGRLERWKGVEYAINSLRYLPDRRLKIAGDGGDRKRLEQVAEMAGVQERVEFLGKVKGDEKWEFLFNVDAVILPSLKNGESFGQVLVEAQLAGAATIASDLPTGVREVLGHGEFGLLVQPGSVEAIVEAVKALDYGEQYADLTQRAFNNAANKYRATVCKDRIREFFLNGMA